MQADFTNKNVYPSARVAAFDAIRNARDSDPGTTQSGWIYADGKGGFGVTPPGGILAPAGGPLDLDPSTIPDGDDSNPRTNSGLEIVGRWIYQPGDAAGTTGGYRDTLHTYFGIDEVWWNSGDDLYGWFFSPTGTFLRGIFAGLFGDPHVVTLDGLRYDLQAVGEFVALKTADDSLQIQVRLGNLGHDRVSFVTATAVNLAGNRVICFAGDPPLVSIDGEDVDREALRGGRDLSGGGRITATRRGLRLVSPAGDLLSIDLPRADFLGLFVTPAVERMGNVSGLYGDFDGDPSNDLLVRGTTEPIVLPNIHREPEAHHDVLYDTFAASWRLTAAESLFPYVDGTSTATYTDLEFPRQAVSLDDLDPAAVAVAKTALAARGITPRHPLYDDFMLDLVETGDPTMADVAVAVLEESALLAALAGHAAPRLLPPVVVPADAVSYQFRETITVTFEAATERVLVPLRIRPPSGRYSLSRTHGDTANPPVRYQLFDADDRPLIEPFWTGYGFVTNQRLEAGDYTLLLLPNPSAPEGLGTVEVELAYFDQ